MRAGVALGGGLAGRRTKSQNPSGLLETHGHWVSAKMDGHLSMDWPIGHRPTLVFLESSNVS